MSVGRLPFLQVVRAATMRGCASRILRLFDYGTIDYRFFSGASFPPQSVCLILSEKCNLRCRMCDIGYRNAHPDDAGSQLVEAISAGAADMALADWKRLIDDLGRFTPRPLVLLTGTEPLLYPHVRDVAEHVAQAGLRLHITTNGTLLETHAPWLAALRPDIAVSLDGPAAIHDAIRGVAGTYGRALQGIEAFAQRSRDLYGRPAPVNITCTVSDANCRSLEALADAVMATGLPVASITFNHLWFKDERIIRRHNDLCGSEFPVAQENVRGIALADIDIEEALRQIQALRQRYRGRLRIHEMPELGHDEAAAYYADPCRFVFYNRCTALWRNVAVTPKGAVIVSPLCFLPPLGNVQDEPFSRLWNGPQAKSLRRRLRQARAFPACSRCCMLFGSKPKFYKLKDWLA